MAVFRAGHDDIVLALIETDAAGRTANLAQTRALPINKAARAGRRRRNLYALARPFKDCSAARDSYGRCNQRAWRIPHCLPPILSEASARWVASRVRPGPMVKEESGGPALPAVRNTTLWSTRFETVIPPGSSARAASRW